MKVRLRKGRFEGFEEFEEFEGFEGFLVSGFMFHVSESNPFVLLKADGN